MCKGRTLPPPFPKQKTKQKTSATQQQHRAFHTCGTKQSVIVSHSISIFSLLPPGSLKRSCLRGGREQRSSSPTHNKPCIPITKVLASYQSLLSKASHRKSLPLKTFHFLAAEIESSSSRWVKACHSCEKSRAKDMALFIPPKWDLLTDS